MTFLAHLPRVVARCFIAASLILVLGAASLTRPPVDTDMVERSLTGAEWLAARADTLAETNPDRRDKTLMGWLLTLRQSLGPESVDFRDYLAEIGYEPADLAPQLWMEELGDVLRVMRLVERQEPARPLVEIEAELRTLPTVPIDEQGAVERLEILAERAVALVPDQERKAVESAYPRLNALRAQAGLR
jgi:hypothetical protein